MDANAAQDRDSTSTNQVSNTSYAVWIVNNMGALYGADRRAIARPDFGP
jgi:hypothetical protein